MKRLPCLLILSLLLLPATAAVRVLDSGDRQVTLLELFTSQGCSSCPPAERWLNTYIDRRDALWHAVVPVAWHVDYWDDIGWPDPYAQPAYSERQRNYVRTGRASTVYTPGFFLNGRDWRGWTLRLPPRASGRTPGNLHVEIDGQQLLVRFPGTGVPLQLHLALLGAGIETEVLRGENRNRTLQQEFVVLAHSSHAGSEGLWHVSIPSPGKHSAPRYALAVWVCEADTNRPLQATGTWLEPSP